MNYVMSLAMVTTGHDLRQYIHIIRAALAGVAGMAAFVGPDVVSSMDSRDGQPSHGVELSRGARRLLGRTNNVFARTDFLLRATMQCTTECPVVSPSR
jgi:hypothetical protein